MATIELKVPLIEEYSKRPAITIIPIIIHDFLIDFIMFYVG
jgi:hypothetical protein